MLPTTYTAAHLALAIGHTRQAMPAKLAGCAPSGPPVMVQGRAVLAWCFGALPGPLQADLTARAEQLNYRNAESLLADPAPRWQSPLPLAEIAPRCLAAAAKLQRALARPLARRNDRDLAAAELAQLGRAEYQQAFGHAISARHWHRLFKRTLKRAGGAEEFDRLEIYLAERPTQKQKAENGKWQAENGEFPELHDVLAGFQNAAAPTKAELEFLWLRAEQAYQARIGGAGNELATDETRTSTDGKKRKAETEAKSETHLSQSVLVRVSSVAVSSGTRPVQVRRALSSFLFGAVPGLSTSAAGVDKKFRRLLARRQALSGQVAFGQDRRAGHSGHYRAPVLPEADRRLLTAAAAKFGGGIEQAWALVHSHLSPEIRAYYPGTKRCPALVRAAFRHDVVIARLALHGPRARRTAGAFVNCDPSNTKAGDWDQSDDMTMVNVWWDDAPDSPTGWWCGQGQLLVWIDVRSWFVYGWDLISDPFYDGFSVRNSWNAKAADWGLPGRGLLLEKGIWATAKVLHGDTPPRESAVGLAESASALERLGLRFQHATHARGKVIERCYGKFQDLLQAAPGYVGRNPLTDRYEEVQRQLLQVKRPTAPEHPSQFFLKKIAMMEVLKNVFLRHNETPMGGKWHVDSHGQERSPRQVYEAEHTGQLTRLPEAFAHYFMDEVFDRRVTGNGVLLKFGAREYRYKGETLGAYCGQKVRLYFRPGDPFLARCTDLEGKNPFVVELEQPVFRTDPQPGTLDKAQRQNALQNRYAKELHQSLKPYYNGPFFQRMFRQVEVDPAAIETAQEFTRQTAEIKQRQTSDRRNEARAHQAARAAGTTLIPEAARRPGMAENLIERKQLQEQSEAQEAAAPRGGGPVGGNPPGAEPTLSHSAKDLPPEIPEPPSEWARLLALAEAQEAAEKSGRETNLP